MDSPIIIRDGRKTINAVPYIIGEDNEYESWDAIQKHSAKQMLEQLRLLYSLPDYKPSVECLHRFTDEEKQTAAGFSSSVTDYKMHKESCRTYKSDHGSMGKRWTTGNLGETAVGALLNANIADTTVGDASEYVHADLKNLGINCGVKTAVAPNFPLIYRDSSPENNRDWGEAQIIVILSHDQTWAWILGVITWEDLQDIVKDGSGDAFVRSRNVIWRKTTVSVFDKIQSFSTIQDLRRITGEKTQKLA